MATLGSTLGRSTAVGYKALGDTSSSSNNTAVGSEALRYTTGGSNTAIGNLAGVTSTVGNENKSGAQNTYLGADSGPGTATQLSNTTAIGYGARVTASNQVVIGNTSVTQTLLNGSVGIGTTNPGTTLQVAGVISPSADNTHDLGTSSLRFKDIYAANNVIQTSDARLKTDVKDSDLGLDFINDLRPVSYYWKEGDPRLHYGLIAQEAEVAVSKAKRSAARENEVKNVIVTHDDETDRYGVRYTELIAPIVKAIQELYSRFTSHDSRLTALEAKDAHKDRSIASKAEKTEVEALKSENRVLRQENAEMKARLDRIEKMLNSK
ncbi:MAG: tail fiber domain-containing protein [Oligoflexia bacterium]|nr:tail fiber domain-containing protein [Oligoflexia bacterium]